MQVFLDQQQVFRQQMGNLLGQGPWAMMNQLTERNLELWQEFQRSMGTGFAPRGSTPDPTKPKDEPAKTGTTSRSTGGSRYSGRR